MRKIFLKTLCVLLIFGPVTLILSSIFQRLLYFSFILNWPGMFILGIDDIEERYGYVGTLFLYFILSVPVIILYSYILALLISKLKQAYEESLKTR